MPRHSDESVSIYSEQSIPDDEKEKISYGRAVFSNGVLPNNFSINLGAAPCNHSCLFCPQSVEKPKKAVWLDLQILEKVLNEMPEENILLNISSYSETITAPNLLPAVELMKKIRPGLQIAMASNGSVFREETIRELMRLGLDHYSYSFDAANREDYARLMQKDDFERVWRNLDRIVEIRDEMSSSMKLTTHIMGFKGQEQHFDRFRKYWEPKLDAVLWRRVANWGGDYLGLEANLAKIGLISAHETPSARVPCTSIFMHFKLQMDGNYFPCVAAVPAFDKHLVPSLGHASKVTWMQAWEKLSEMRQAHLNGNWDDYECCKTCNVWSMWDDMWFEHSESDHQSRFFLKEVEHAV